MQVRARPTLAAGALHGDEALRVMLARWVSKVAPVQGSKGGERPGGLHDDARAPILRPMIIALVHRLRKRLQQLFRRARS